MQGWTRVLWRFLYFSAATTLHVIWYGFIRLSGGTKVGAGMKIRRHWLNIVPERMGIRTKVVGTPEKSTCLFVANHISYLDPIIILMNVEANVIAKSEVRSWPLIGFAGKLMGAIFVNRHKKSSRNKTAGLIYGALKEGTSILIFPEGTTTRGNTILPFRPRSFEAAFSAGVPIQAVMISYNNESAAFVDDHNFLAHFFNLFREKRIESNVTFGPVFTHDNACKDSHDWMEAYLTPHSLIEV